MTDVIKQVASTILKTQNKDKYTGYDITAKVTRVEGDTIWVHFDGGVDETPCKRTVKCSPGETVRVRISNGSAWVLGNSSSPATDDTIANAVKKTAITYVIVEYAQGTDQSIPPSSGWSSVTPQWEDGKYVWQRTVKMVDGELMYSEPVCIQGASGTDGTDVSNVKAWYKSVSRSSPAPTVSPTATESDMIYNGWTTTEPPLDMTTKMYRVDQCIFGDGTYTWGVTSLSTSYEAAIEASTTATSYLKDTTTSGVVDGVFMHASGASEDPTASGARGVKISEQIDIIRDGMSVIAIGEDDENVRIGNSNEARMIISPNELNMYGMYYNNSYHGWRSANVLRITSSSETQTSTITQSINESFTNYIDHLSDAVSYTLDSFPDYGSRIADTFEFKLNDTKKYFTIYEAVPFGQWAPILYLRAGEKKTNQAVTIHMMNDQYAGTTVGYGYVNYDGKKTITYQLRFSKYSIESHLGITITSSSLKLKSVDYTPGNLTGCCFTFGDRASNYESAGYSTVFGEKLIADQSYQFVCGRCNASNPEAALIVGNGTAAATTYRSNAFQVGWDGSIKYDSNVVNENYVISGVAGLSESIESRIVRVGSICHATFYVYNSSNILGGKDILNHIFSDSEIPQRLWPQFTVTGSSYFGKHAISAKFNKDGNLVVRNACDIAFDANTLTSSSNIVVSFFYISKDAQ